ncbi:hypothetical protein MPTK1_5g11810 [Marchantia polymorpha subsp. ruderalis]|uniref:Uncharacterized protein n=2 Tax=Marchantia polymorpha TaxID=3197 RepID=A0AAF6BHE5_MARPO|nr:hypothetical protein MARPO_0143s0009 [Marchantia polymorpha]BBN11429.1 hypothetical protein Mp_5g11810 [Marchantia polymorpha subsp. ruderalis]|eukprot:PTQ29327.1 hypothetical protein MARPO_0143s0009 [Marchantia polymorpha]
MHLCGLGEVLRRVSEVHAWMRGWTLAFIVFQLRISPRVLRFTTASCPLVMKSIRSAAPAESVRRNDRKDSFRFIHLLSKWRTVEAVKR